MGSGALGCHPERPTPGAGRALGPSLLRSHLRLCPQPERINPELNQKGYSVKSDIWSLGITMVGSPGGWQGSQQGSVDSFPCPQWYWGRWFPAKVAGWGRE